MEGNNRMLILVLAAAAICFFMFGCTDQLANYGINVSQLPNYSAGGAVVPAADTVGPALESLNQKIYSASSSSDVSSARSELATLKAKAISAGYTKYLQLIDAQNLTLDVLAAYMEFKTESASIGTTGVDCSKNYTKFIADMKATNSTADSAISKVKSYLASNPNSTAGLLTKAIDTASPLTMVTYADMLQDEVDRVCLPLQTPSKTYTLPISKSDALEIAAGVAGDTYFVYGLDTPLAAGTMISVPDGYNWTLKTKTWFFFLDSQPWAPFGHDVKYVMVQEATGKYTVSNQTMFPVIGGKPYWKSTDERMNPNNVLYPDDAATYLTLPGVTASTAPSYNPYATYMEGYISLYGLATSAALNTANAGRSVNSLICCPTKNKYALIITGSNDSMFQADTARMYGFLRGQGFSDANINYMGSQAGVANADSSTTGANFVTAMAWLASNAKCCDEVFIYLAGHGSKDQVRQFRNRATNATRWIRSVADLGAGAANWEATGRTGHYHGFDLNRGKPGGSWVSSQYLRDFVSRIMSCDVTLMYQSCFSGAARNVASLPGVRVMTPVDAWHSSYGFNADTTTWKQGSMFSQAYINAFGKDNATADANGEGTVTKREAFNFADTTNRNTVEGWRTGLRAAANAEANATTAARYRARADGLERQNGQYVEGPPCWCCYVNCTEATNWKCLVFEAMNQPNCPECQGKKVGDYCKNVTENITTPNVTENVTITPVCGNNKTEPPEECESNADCPKYRYCNLETCKCKQYPLICGDGNIAAGEECDPKANPTGCDTGYVCDNCKCKEPAASCGDGKVSGSEECESNSDCATGMVCNMNTCKCVAGTTGGDGGEGYCGDGTVKSPEQCENDAHCPSGKTCVSCYCVDKSSVCGNGDIESGEECEPNANPTGCSAGKTCAANCKCVDTPTYCGDGAKNGNEECDPTANPTGCDSGQACSVGCTCVSPPNLNCNEICSYTAGAQNFGGSYNSQTECANAVKSHYGTTTCYLTCTYAWYYAVTNIAGTSSCCCGMKKMFPCSDCPGQNPQCPGEETCQQNAPTWYTPPPS